MSSLIYYFPVDLTGENTTNRVIRESHLLVSHAGTDYRVFSLNHGGFYANSLILEDSSYNQLVPEVDYIVDYVYQDTSDRTGLFVGGVIVIINPAITGILYATAQMVGGSLAFDLNAHQNYIEYLILNPGYVVSWGTYIGDERQWGPGELESELWTETTIQDVNIELENLAQVIKAGDQVALTNYRTTAKQLYDEYILGTGVGLQVHEADTTNPHNVTKTQVGLDAVVDLPVASEVDARAGVADSGYMTPLRTAQAIDSQITVPLNTHAANTNNPHGVTATQLGVLTQSDINTTLSGKLNIGARAANATRLLSPVRLPVTTPDWILGSVTIGENYTSVVYGNGRFVAITNVASSFQKAARSVDGINWTAGLLGDAFSWRDIAFGNGLFVVVCSAGAGVSGRVLTSPDGVTWTQRVSPTDVNWNSVTYGNGVFVAVGEDGPSVSNRIMTSPDGINWTLQTGSVADNWVVTVYGNGRFIALPKYLSSAVNPSGMYSDDNGITWNNFAFYNYHWTCAAYGNGVFVALCEEQDATIGQQAAYSVDGINWVLVNTPFIDNHDWKDIVFADGCFYAICDNETRYSVMMSYNGIDWWLRTTPLGSWSAICHGSELLMVVGERYSLRWVRNTQEGEGTLTNMTYSQVFSHLRSQLPTSLLNKQPFSYQRLAIGSNYHSILGLNGTYGQWYDPSWFIITNGIVVNPSIYFMEYTGSEANVVATVSTTYNDIVQYPVGTVVIYRITYSITGQSRRQIRAVMRTSTGWSQI